MNDGNNKNKDGKPKMPDVGICKTIDIGKTKPSKFNVREQDEDQDSEEFQELCESIKSNGLIEPVVVRLDGRNNEYEAIAGTRRLAAMKYLGITHAPAVVRHDMSDNDVRIASIVENIHRRNLDNEEKSQGIFDVYKAAGYQDLFSVTTLLSYVDVHSDELDEDGYFPVVTDSIRNRHKRYDRRGQTPSNEFIDLMRRIGYKPNTQAIYLRTLAEFKTKKLRETVRKSGVDDRKKALLQLDPLPKYPRIQSTLAYDIAKKSFKKAKLMVEQMIYELKNGYRDKDGFPTGKGKPEKLEPEDKIETETTAPVFAREEINQLTDRMFKLITGKKMTNDLHKDEEIAESKASIGNMTSLAKISLAPRELAALQSSINPLSKALNKFVQIIYQAVEDEETKERLDRP